LTPETIGDIRFHNVAFRYGTRQAVFEKLNLVLEKGKTTALLGESGSGKTTLISILQNIYPIQEGKITLGNFDLRMIGNESLRTMVATVPQEVQLFAGSVIENIALGEYEPEMTKLLNICHSLGISDFVEKLPEGYHTQVGEHGLSLSGGERQRIAIARALYKNPEILIFDEATSSLDSISENKVKSTLKKFTDSGKTVILIAHRLSTIRDAAKIIVLKEGKVIETGSHEELYRQKGSYFNLYNASNSNPIN
jgi:ATP-binding cassette, subfamily C, bacteriocin exporter